uniref:uncharacterized protein LOC122599460 n=1 Tax=Erigeron canadensis TaxID=72917 RepID=UPI001CB9B11B|nr:uncharacterized protein LOC122599460 [Erigeron canadensis]
MPTSMTDAINRAGNVTKDLLRSGVLSKSSSSSSKRKDVAESSGVRKMGRFDPKNANRRRVMVVVKPARRPYAGPHPFCNKCNKHHPINIQCGACFKCNQLGHLSRDCRAPGTTSMNVALIQSVPPHGNQRRGECFECGSPHHYRNNCPRWVGQQVQVAVHPNQLQIAG